MAESRDPRANPGAYWKANLRLLLSLLLVWFLVSFVCGILLVDLLNQFRIPGTGSSVVLSGCNDISRNEPRRHVARETPAGGKRTGTAKQGE